MGSEFWAVWGGAFATYLVLLAVRLLVRNHRRILLGTEARREREVDGANAEADALLAEAAKVPPARDMLLSSTPPDPLEQELGALQARVDAREQRLAQEVRDRRDLEVRQRRDKERFRRMCPHPVRSHKVGPEASTCGRCGEDMTNDRSRDDRYEEELPF